MYTRGPANWILLVENISNLVKEADNSLSLNITNPLDSNFVYLFLPTEIVYILLHSVPTVSI